MTSYLSDPWSVSVYACTRKAVWFVERCNGLSALGLSTTVEGAKLDHCTFGKLSSR